ncbi:MAG: 6-phosphofructokinase [Oscillospiraceae bacterium]|jgi:6-phosphofructokinase 1|nr:6-phosphofructokinase [Oscillospiraceae bacterium]
MKIRGECALGCKTISILTSGGDAPGMNAAIRAIVRASISNGIKVLGVRRGFNGLINGDVFEMNIRSVSDIIHKGGTILYTARSPEFRTQQSVLKAAKVCGELGIDSVIVIGGDGSFKGARSLSKMGIPCIGIPGTIDNDIACSEYAIGYDTAMNTAMEMIDKIRDTAQSHDRCSIVEVMGRKCGDIALNTGIAVGATAILVPEVKYDIDKDIIDRIKFTQNIGKKHFIIIVAEGLKNVNKVSKEIKKRTGIDSRITILGHVQRGGTPTLKDRVMASKMGCMAVDMLIHGINDKIIAIKNDKVIYMDILKALSVKKHFDIELYRKALNISI